MKITDRMRLNWLEKKGYPGQFQKNHDNFASKRWFDADTVGSDYSPTLREAIDAAIRASKPKKARGGRA